MTIQLIITLYKCTTEFTQFYTELIMLQSKL